MPNSTDAELSCVDGHRLRPAESEEDHADCADEIDMAGRHDGQAAVVFRSLVAQEDRRPRDDAAMNSGNDQKRQDTEGDRLEGEI